MKDADDAESRRALTFMTDPLGECTTTQHVIMRALEFKPPVARFDETGLGECTRVCASGWLAGVGSFDLESVCNNEWCGF